MAAARENVTQSHISRVTDISLRSLGRYFKGERSVKISDLIKICDAMGISASDILDAAENSL